MRLVFVSQNELGLACLEELLGLDADVRHVFTKPSGASISDQVRFEPLCQEHEVPLTETTSVNNPEIAEKIRACKPDLLFVIGWSELASSTIIDIPSATSLGMHPSPLPRGRGRAPVAWSLIKGLNQTALSFFHLTEKADAGDLVGQESIPIDRTDDAGTLYQKVIQSGRTLINEYYPQFKSGTVPRTSQDDEQATWWPKRTPDHGLIDWTRSPEKVYDWIRGQTHPYPGAFTYLDGQKVTIWGAEPPVNGRVAAAPGTIVNRDGDRLTIAAWEGPLEITRVSVEGSAERPAAHLIEDFNHEIGAQFANAWDMLD